MGRRSAAAASFVALWLLGALVGHRTAAEPVRVGVILDLASAAGRRWKTSIQMAVDDYYASHPNSTTRVELSFKDSSGDAVGAVSAGELIVILAISDNLMITLVAQLT
jgi:glutamate receptor, ionotropic, plant